MHISENGLKLIKKWEGCYLKAYKDCVGVWTIGYGITNADKKITGRTIKAGLTITQNTANVWLEECIRQIYEPKVNKYMEKYHWNQNQYDALVSFCFNIGNIDELTKDGTRSNDTIASKMLEYCKAGGRRVQGLYDRRKDEHNLFIKPVKGSTQPVPQPSTEPTKKVSYYKKYTGTSGSLVDALKAVGLKDTSLEKRKKIAKANGISKYTGTAAQNDKLLKLLKAGKLVKP